MPVLKLYPNGLTGGVPPRKCNPAPALRDECKGWSLRSSRGNTRFLYSVRSPELPCATTGEALIGLSASLTLRRIPESHDEWKQLREAFLVRLRRKGLYRLHWLTEWQRRGAPHLHAAMWFYRSAAERVVAPYDVPVEAFPALVKSDWLELTTARYRAEPGGQDIKLIFDEVGWLQYLSKHAARGAAHYQRALGSIPAGWEKTGRMWGHIGDFPTSEPLGFELSNRHWFEFRRMVRGWRLSQSRVSKEPQGRRIRSARHMLTCKDPTLSRVRGVSEWIPLNLGSTMEDWVSRPKLVNRSAGYLERKESPGRRILGEPALGFMSWVSRLGREVNSHE